MKTIRLIKPKPKTKTVCLALCFMLTGLAPSRASSDLPAPSKDDWIDLASLRAGLVLDLRYGTADNFTGEILYPVPKAFLRPEPALALAAVQKELKAQRLGLKVFDAYRPLPVQQKMWDLIRDERYVSNPAVNAGRHTRGASVDVTLVDAEGAELAMPTGFDDFSEKAHRDYAGATPEQKKNRELLRTVMEKHGFTVYPTEWWHFDYRGWKEYPPASLSIGQIVPAGAPGAAK